MKNVIQFTSLVLNFLQINLVLRIFNHYIVSQQVVNFFRFYFGWRVGVFYWVIYLLVFCGKTFHFKWRLKCFIYLYCFHVQYMSNFFLSYYLVLKSNFFRPTIEINKRQELPISCSSFASSLLLLSYLMYLWRPFSSWYGNVLLSAIIFQLYSCKFL